MIRQGEAPRPVRPGDIVILLRSPGSCARYYRSALEARGIPALAGAGGSMLDTGEAAVLRSFLQVLDNPLQDIPLEAVLASPVFRFTADHLGRIRAACPDGPLFEALSQAAEAGDSQSGAFLELVQSLRQAARLESLTRLLEEVYARTHMEAVFAAMAGGDKRRRNLEFLYETAASFEQGAGGTCLSFWRFWMQPLNGASSRRRGERTGCGEHPEHPQVQGPGVSGGVPQQSLRRLQPGGSAGQCAGGCPAGHSQLPWTGRTDAGIPPWPSGPLPREFRRRTPPRSRGCCMWP